MHPVNYLGVFAHLNDGCGGADASTQVRDSSDFKIIKNTSSFAAAAANLLEASRFRIHHTQAPELPATWLDLRKSKPRRGSSQVYFPKREQMPNGQPLSKEIRHALNDRSCTELSARLHLKPEALTTARVLDALLNHQEA